MITADIILVIIALVGLTISSIVDIKTREIPNWTNFSMIAAALAVRLMHSSLTLEWNYFLYGLLGFGVMFALGHIMYYTKQWGGGDSKLLFAMGAIFATKPYFVKEFPAPFLLIIFMAILVTGAAYSIIYSFILAFIHRKEFWKALKEIHASKRILRSTIILVSVAIGTIGLFINPNLGFPLASLAAITIIATYWIIFAKAIESACLIKSISVSKLTEGDWILDEKIKKKFKIPNLGIELKQINALKKSSIKKITVKEGIPFAPAFLIATIIILIL